MTDKQLPPYEARLVETTLNACTPDDLASRLSCEVRKSRVAHRIAALNGAISGLSQKGATDARRSVIQRWTEERDRLVEHRQMLEERSQVFNSEQQRTWGRAFQRATRDLVSEEMYERIIARAKDLDETQKRRSESMLVGGAIGVRGIAGGSWQRKV